MIALRPDPQLAIIAGPVGAYPGIHLTLPESAPSVSNSMTNELRIESSRPGSSNRRRQSSMVPSQQIKIIDRQSAVKFAHRDNQFGRNRSRTSIVTRSLLGKNAAACRGT